MINRVCVLIYFCFVISTLSIGRQFTKSVKMKNIMCVLSLNFFLKILFFKWQKAVRAPIQSLAIKMRLAISLRI